MFNRTVKISLFIVAAFTLCSCEWRFKSLSQIMGGSHIPNTSVENTPLREASSVVVCRSKQCAPAKLSMSNEYIYNSLLHLFENNNHKKALICQANPSSRSCLESYITLPITVGISPAYMYIDSAKITDVIINKGSNTLNLILNYNVTYNGQTPDCTPAQSIVYVRNVNHILLEDPGYTCKMTSIGTSNIKTVFVIDYIDLDYGFIGGYYSIGLSGPAYGGGTGYMILRLPKDAYPLAPELKASRKRSIHSNNMETQITNTPSGEEIEISVSSDTALGLEEENVKVFPIKK